jgi:heat-inducible transcriptional repressor
MEMTQRQAKILRAIIEEYMNTAEEVGSNQLVEKYDLGVSSATVRNEMAELMELGYLNKTHVSSGRVPTDQAFRVYIKNMLDEFELNPLEKVEVRQTIFRDRFNPDRLQKVILEVLARRGSCASFLMTNKFVRYHGVSRLMNYQELQEIQVVQRILDLLEDETLLHNLLDRYMSKEVGLIIGSELGVEDMEECSLAFTVVPFWDKKDAYFGVIGSRRLDYRHVMAIMKNVRAAVEESLRGWR